MATYNGGRHIQRQFESLAAQTYLPAELVITDDASTDDTVTIVEAFAKSSPFPVRVHRNESRVGYRANFMRAANLCESHLIAFCDQDDVWYPHKLATAVEPFSDADVLLSYHNADSVAENGTRIGSLADRAASSPIAAPLSLGPWWPSALGFTEVFRRSLLALSDLWPRTINHMFEGQPLGHDQWIFILASVFGKIAYVAEPLAAYMQHGDNTFGWRKLSFGDRVKWWLRDRSEYDRVGVASERLASILDLAKPRFDGVWADRANAGSDYYHRVAWLYAHRKDIHVSPHFGARLKAFAELVSINGYAPKWGQGRDALIADFCLGVIPLGSILRSANYGR